MEKRIDFLSVLGDKELSFIFEEWTKKDFSYENYSFYKEIEDYKTTKPEEIEKKSNYIYKKYFTLGSEWEINTDSHQKLKLKENMKNPTVDIFNDIQISIFLLMKNDSYSRFIRSEEYLEWEEKREILETKNRGKKTKEETEEEISKNEGTKNTKKNKKKKRFSYNILFKVEKKQKNREERK